MIKVIIVDDQRLIREGIEILLAAYSNIKVIAKAENGDEAIRLVRSLKPDVVLMDYKMPGIDGLEVTRRLSKYSDVKIVILTIFGEEPFPSRILQAGAHAYLTKDASPEEMHAAIESVFRGKKYICESVAQQLALKTLSQDKESESPFDLLSEREIQVMTMIVNGYKVQDISDQLCLSPKTINSYRYRIFDKLGISSDVELTRMAIRHGILDSLTLLE